jgi:hypothetical protein
MIPSLIGFTGLIGSGKSFAARYLADKYGYEVVKFAGPLKDMMRAIGLTEDHIEGHLKEIPCDQLCGKTPRFAMQTLGTEWGRDILGDNLWGNLWKHKVQKMLDAGKMVVTDDVRFSSESDRVKSMGGLVIKLTIKGNSVVGDHSSEIQDLTPSILIENDPSQVGSLEQTLDFLVASVAAATHKKQLLETKSHEGRPVHRV